MSDVTAVCVNGQLKRLFVPPKTKKKTIEIILSIYLTCKGKLNGIFHLSLVSHKLYIHRSDLHRTKLEVQATNDLTLIKDPIPKASLP